MIVPLVVPYAVVAQVSDRDLFYQAVAQKRYKDAIVAGRRYLDAHPDDAAFAADLAGAVAAEQRSAPWSAQSADPRFQSYGYGQYEGQYGDTFFGVDTQYVLAPGKLQPYLANHIVSDPTSGTSGRPQIYSDNAVIFDAGLKAGIGPYVSLFAEGGVGIGTRGEGTITDLRYGVNYSQRWGSHAFTEVDGSAAIYSRYSNNAIAYFSLLHHGVGRRVRPVAGINGGFDEKAQFGNNFAEGFAGLEFGTEAIAVRLLQVGGVYFTRGLSAPQTGYTTFRAVLVFGLSK